MYTITKISNSSSKKVVDVIEFNDKEFEKASNAWNALIRSSEIKNLYISAIFKKDSVVISTVN